MTTAQIVAWAEAQDAAGKRDAMGFPFTSWLLARRHPDGRAMRDQAGRQMFETQADFKARQPDLLGQSDTSTLAIGQTMELFA